MDLRDMRIESLEQEAADLADSVTEYQCDLATALEAVDRAQERARAAETREMQMKTKLDEATHLLQLAADGLGRALIKRFLVSHLGQGWDDAA